MIKDLVKDYINNKKERCRNKELGIAFKIVPFRIIRTNVFVNMRLGTKVSSFILWEDIWILVLKHMIYFLNFAEKT